MDNTTTTPETTGTDTHTVQLAIKAAALATLVGASVVGWHRRRKTTNVTEF